MFHVKVLLPRDERQYQWLFAGNLREKSAAAFDGKLIRSLVFAGIWICLVEGPAFGSWYFMQKPQCLDPGFAVVKLNNLILLHSEGFHGVAAGLPWFKWPG